MLRSFMNVRYPAKKREASRTPRERLVKPSGRPGRTHGGGPVGEIQRVV
jgi:hypothetical protein